MSGDKVDSPLHRSNLGSSIAYVGSSRYSARSIKGIVVKTQPVLCYHYGVKVTSTRFRLAKQFALYSVVPLRTSGREQALGFGIFRDNSAVCRELQFPR